MSNLYKQMGSTAHQIIIFMFPLAIVVCAISVILMIEDYRTSLAGYLMMPTSKVNHDIVPIAVAALPQFAQILLMYVGFRDTSKRWAIFMAFFLFLIDTGTDVYFKANGSWGLVPLATLESIAIFTVGSEILFAISVGFIVETFGDFMASVGVFVASVIQAINAVIESVMGSLGNQGGNGKNRGGQNNG